ncbi:radical SAM protein [Pirellulaceae bacterium SH501]
MKQEGLPFDPADRVRPPHWLDVLGASSSSDLGKRRAWKVLREGGPLECHLGESGWSKSWMIAKTIGRPESGAVKHQLRSNRYLDDCEMVVLFPRVGKRATVCISSQVGCGVGCLFCATGTMGLKRNLSPEEMLEQVYLARVLSHQSGRHLRNVVLMGMGEPLHNLEAVCQSIEFMVRDRGFGLRERHITVSTSGIPSAMLQLIKRFTSVRMALSLHSAEAEDRRRLMPKAPNDLPSLRETLREINAIQGRDGEAVPVWIEYVLIDSWNDTDRDAERLIDFCRGLRVEVNLIPLNGTVTAGKRALSATSKERQQKFAEMLRGAGIKTTIRNSFGNEEQAACGQLVTY